MSHTAIINIFIHVGTVLSVSPPVCFFHNPISDHNVEQVN